MIVSVYVFVCVRWAITMLTLNTTNLLCHELNTGHFLVDLYNKINSNNNETVSKNEQWFTSCICYIYGVIRDHISQWHEIGSICASPASHAEAQTLVV